MVHFGVGGPGLLASPWPAAPEWSPDRSSACCPHGGPGAAQPASTVARPTSTGGNNPEQPAEGGLALLWRRASRCKPGFTYHPSMRAEGELSAVHCCDPSGVNF